MRCTVRALANLRHYLPSGRETVVIEVPELMNVQGLMELLSIPLPEIMMIKRQGSTLEAESALNDGDVVEIYPVLSGG